MVSRIIESAEEALRAVGLHASAPRSGISQDPDFPIFVSRQSGPVKALADMVGSGVPLTVVLRVEDVRIGLIYLEPLYKDELDVRWVLYLWTREGFTRRGWVSATPEFDSPDVLTRLATNAGVAFP